MKSFTLVGLLALMTNNLIGQNHFVFQKSTSCEIGPSFSKVLEKKQNWI